MHEQIIIIIIEDIEIAAITPPFNGIENIHPVDGQDPPKIAKYPVTIEQAVDYMMMTIDRKMKKAILPYPKERTTTTQNKNKKKHFDIIMVRRTMMKKTFNFKYNKQNSKER